MMSIVVLLSTIELGWIILRDIVTPSPLPEVQHHALKGPLAGGLASQALGCHALAKASNTTESSVEMSIGSQAHGVRYQLKQEQ